LPKSRDTVADRSCFVFEEASKCVYVLRDAEVRI
jgi:hypothetical protein